MKKLESLLKEFSVTSEAGQAILKDQEALFETIDQEVAQVEEGVERVAEKAKSDIEKALAPLYKALQ